MSSEFGQNVPQMLIEFEKNILQKLNQMDEKISDAEERMTQKISDVEKNMAEKISNLDKRVESIEYKLDTVTNTNLAKILNEQTRHNIKCEKEHEDMMKQMEIYETENQLEHKRLDYEVYKLKANA